MAFIELTRHDDHKLIINTDHILGFADYTSGGGHIMFAMAKNTDLNALHDLKVKETKDEIENLLARSALRVIR